MLAPIAPAPATRITAAPAPRARRRSAGAAARARRRRSARPAAHAPPSRTRGTGSARARRAAARPRPTRSAVGSRTSAATTSGYTDARPDTAPAAPRGEPAGDQRLGADEDVEPVEQVRLDRLPRLVGDLEPAQVRRRLAQPLDHRDRHGVAAAHRELVDVERQRRARGRRSREVRLERAPRPAGRTAARSRRPPSAPASAACAASAAVSAVDCAPQCTATGTRPRGGRDEQLRHAPPLGEREQDPLAGRAAARGCRRRRPPTRKSTYGAKRALVERRAAVPKRRQRRRERTRDHAAQHTIRSAVIVRIVLWNLADSKRPSPSCAATSPTRPFPPSRTCPACCSRRGSPTTAASAGARSTSGSRPRPPSSRSRRAPAS